MVFSNTQIGQSESNLTLEGFSKAFSVQNRDIFFCKCNVCHFLATQNVFFWIVISQMQKLSHSSTVIVIN